MKGTLIVPPTIKAQLSGAAHCWKSPRQTVLTYLDGTKETVSTAALEKLPVDWDNWFSIVSGVQALRKAVAS